MIRAKVRSFGRLLAAVLVWAFFLAWGEREAAADVDVKHDYEILILRLNDAEDTTNGASELCRWWYLVWEYGNWSLYPIVPEGWLKTYSCESTALSGGGASEAGR